MKSYFFVVGLLVTLSLLAIVFAITQAMKGESGFSSQQDSTSIKAKQIILDIHLDGNLDSRMPNQEHKAFQEFFFGDERKLLADINRTLEKAEKDNRIVGAVLRLSNLNGSLPDIMSLRRSLQNLRNSGRGIHAFAPSMDHTHYFLASVAERITMPTIGDLSLLGPSLSSVYFGGLMQKIGVDFTLVRAGKYKSFVEPFLQNDPSPEATEMYLSLVGDLGQQLVSQIATGRALPTSQVESWFRRSLFRADEAMAEGMIDATSSYQDFLQGVKEKWPEAEVVSFKRFQHEMGSAGKALNSLASTGDGVGYIEAFGDIVMDSPRKEPGMIMPSRMIAELKWMEKQASVKSIVLRINSPGGSALASHLIWEEVQRINKVKPIVVSMGDVAASGGYYIGAAATRILAEPSTLTGSIGVFGILPNFAAFRDKYGVSFHTHTLSDRAALLNASLKPSEEDIRLIDSQIDLVYRTFLDIVAQGRNMDAVKVESLAAGRVWTGQQALEQGLVDEMGDVQHSLRVAKSLGGLDPNELVPLYRYRSDSSLEECLGSLSQMLECLEMGGSESRIAAALSQFGVDRGFFSLLGGDSLADSLGYTLRNQGFALSRDRFDILAILDPAMLRDGNQASR
jgi:protease-4